METVDVFGTAYWLLWGAIRAIAVQQPLEIHSSRSGRGLERKLALYCVGCCNVETFDTTISCVRRLRVSGQEQVERYGLVVRYRSLLPVLLSSFTTYKTT